MTYSLFMPTIETEMANLILILQESDLYARCKHVSPGDIANAILSDVTLMLSKGSLALTLFMIDW